MNNDELLQALADRLESGEISAEDVAAAMGPAASSTKDSDAASRLSKVLYYIGGAIVFFGLAFFIGQQWDDFGTTMKIFVTLGSGIASFVVGVLLSGQARLGAAGPAFFMISAMLIPLGMLVTYDEAGIDVDMLTVQMQVAGVLFAAYVAAYAGIRRNVLLVFAFGFGTWLFFAFTDYIILGAPYVDDWDYLNYRVAALGLTSCLLGYSFLGTEREPLTSWLYGLGVLGFLGATLALTGWKPDQSIFWEAVYPGLVIGVIMLSTHLKSRTFLVFGSLALGCYLTKITDEYFSDSLGWALSLIILGFLLMGFAYLAVRVNRRYVAA